MAEITTAVQIIPKTVQVIPQTRRGLPASAWAGTLQPIKPQASGQPYDGAATGRRAAGWNVSRLGPNTLLWGNADQLVARSRDQVRNNPWAKSAERSWKANAIGNGIKLQSKHKSKKIRRAIELAFHRWTLNCDPQGVLDLYGKQAVVAGELFQAGEVFTRLRVVKRTHPNLVPLKLQLIEAEQLPYWKTVISGALTDNSLRSGIEFNPDGERVAYHFYKEHPGETMYYPLEGLQTQPVPATNVVHTFETLRAGQFRGQPHMAPVLALLYELDKLFDAEVMRRQISTMFAGFVKKISSDYDIVPADPNAVDSQGSPIAVPPGVTVSRLEAGTLTDLLPGEEVQWSTPPDAGGLEGFLYQALCALAAGWGLTYYQLTGDLTKVNYSSMRAGLLEFRRACEAYQRNVLIQGFCRPVFSRWLKEAVISGVLDLPGYADDPWQYEDVAWVTPGWDWVDPLKDVQAAIAADRAGYTSRSRIVAARGEDVETIDAEKAADNASSDANKLILDSDPRNTLARGETNPPKPAEPAPQDAEEKAAEGEQEDL